MRRLFLLFLLLSPTMIFSQSLPELSISGNDAKVSSINDLSSHRYIALYLSSGLYAAKEYDDVVAKAIFAGDISFQFNDWFYLDLKLETYNHKNSTYGAIIGIFPVVGTGVFNDKRFLLMSGAGISIIGVKGGHGLGTLFSAFSRLRYELTKVFGVFTEARYGITTEGHVGQHFFLTAGISLQAPLKTPSF